MERPKVHSDTSGRWRKDTLEEVLEENITGGSDITLGLNARPKVLYFCGSDANFARGLKYYNVANFALTSDRPRPRPTY